MKSKVAYDDFSRQIGERQPTTDESTELDKLRKVYVAAQTRHKRSRALRINQLRDIVALRINEEACINRLQGIVAGPEEVRAAIEADTRDDEDEGNDDSAGKGRANEHDHVRSHVAEVVQSEYQAPEGTMTAGDEDEAAIAFAQHFLGDSQAASSSERPHSNLSVRLVSSLSRLAREFSSNVTVKSFGDHSIKSSGETRASINDVFAEFESDLGTQKADTLAFDAIEVCPSCQKQTSAISSIQQNVEKHIDSCSRVPAQKRYRAACQEALALQPCPFKECHDTHKIFEPTIEEIEKHLRRHRNRAAGRNKCLFVYDDGTECGWTSEESSDEQFDKAYSAQLAHHIEEVHGIPAVHMDAFKLCRWHRQWHFGAVQLEDHYSEHVDELLSADERSLSDWSRLVCPFCAADEELSMANRGHVFAHRAAFNRHVLVAHFYENREQFMTCPCCRQSVDARDIPEHFREHHGRNLGLSDPPTLGRNFSLLQPLLKAKYIPLAQEWLSWTQTLDAADASQTLGETSTELNPTTSVYGSNVSETGEFHSVQNGECLASVM